MKKCRIGLLLVLVTSFIPGCEKREDSGESLYGVRKEIVTWLKKDRSISEDFVKNMLTEMKTSDSQIFDDGYGLLVLTLEQGEKTDTQEEARARLDTALDRWKGEFPDKVVDVTTPIQGFV